jgi:hypothetical protein
MPYLDMSQIPSSAYTISGPTDYGKFTITPHDGPMWDMDLYVKKGSAASAPMVYANGQTFEVGMPIDEGVYFFENAEFPGKYMQIDDDVSSSTNGAIMELWDFDGDDDQKWELDHISDGKYKILSVESGKALTAPSSVNGSVTQKTYTGATNQLWYITANTNGSYALTNSTYYLAAGDGIFTSDGRNVEGRYEQSDAKDEWNLIKSDGTEGMFLGIRDEGHDHSSAFGHIAPEMQQLGCSDFNYIVTDNASLTTVRNGMANAKIFVSRSHGGSDSLSTYILIDQNGAYLGTSQIYNYSLNAKIVDLSKCDLAIFIACHTADHTDRSLVHAAVAAGASVSIGFKGEIGCDAANKWVNFFFEYYIQGYSAQYSAQQAAAQSGGISADQILVLPSNS